VFRYQAQVTLLASILRPVYGKDMEIGTVDGMQGREKDAVIISLVRSNEKVNAFTFRFLGLKDVMTARGWIPQGQTQA
jgi:superfamily I DNA and/or RNA helicase